MVACKQAMSALIDLLHEMGFLVAWRKVVTPSQSVTYLGILLDSISLTLSLPAPKVDRIRSYVDQVSNRSSSTVKELQVLAGHLVHASTVVRGGRTFSRRVINLLKYVARSTGVVKHPSWLAEDLSWWQHFMSVFNGSAKIVSDIREYEIPVETDSSTSGFAAVWGHTGSSGYGTPHSPLNVSLLNTGNLHPKITPLISISTS